MASKEVQAGKVPPQSLDAEKSLLGAVLIDDEVLADVSEFVTPKDFYDKLNQEFNFNFEEII